MAVARKEAWGMSTLKEFQEDSTMIATFSDEKLQQAIKALDELQHNSTRSDVAPEDDIAALNMLLSRPVKIPELEQSGRVKFSEHIVSDKLSFEESPKVKFMRGRSRRFAAAQALELLGGEQKKATKYSRFILDPDGPYVWILDYVNLFVCLYTLFAEPYLLSLAHFTSGSDWRSTAPGALVFFSTCCDVFMIFDFIASHFKGYTFYTAGKQARTELRPTKTFQKYASTWFVLDGITLFPVQIMLYLNNHSFTAVDGLFVMSVLKLFKIVRFFKGLDELKKYCSWSFFAMSQCFFFVVFIAHFLSCFWLITISQAAISSNNDICTNRKGLMITQDASAQYTCALSWAVAMGTTLGTGDIHPQSQTERTFAVISAFVLAAVFFYNLVYLFSRQSDLEQALQLEMLQALEYSRDKKLPPDFLNDIRWFYNEKHRLGILGDASAQWIPSFARVAAFLEHHARHVSLIEFLSIKDITDLDFWTYFLDICETKFYLPQDWLQRQHNTIGRLFILMRGTAKEVYEPSGHIFRVLEAGEWFCDRRALPEYPRGKVTSGAQVTGSQLCETLELSADGLQRLRQRYPEVYAAFEPACRARQNNLGRSVWTRVWSAHKGDIMNMAAARRQATEETLGRPMSAEFAVKATTAPSITRLPSELDSDDDLS